jgi:recombination protein RecR
MSPLIEQLTEALRILPGVGPKTAQRMVLHLLERNPKGALKLSEILKATIEGVGRCRQCRNLTEHEVCSLCENPARDNGQLCVVENPADVIAIEQAGGFKGRFFVLMGHLSPIDGIGPEALGLDQLVENVVKGGVEEVILAVNPTVEGEATAHYIMEMLKSHPVVVSRLAHGIPMGGELEYIDGNTIAHALAGRRPF